MWISCDTDCDLDIEIKYYIDNEFFVVKSNSSSQEISHKTILFARFYSDDEFNEFEIGNYSFEDGKYILDKKYSISYLNSQKIDINKFSCFMLNTASNKKIIAYPQISSVQNIYCDRSIIHAKEVLSSEKSNQSSHSIEEILNNIKIKIKSYRAMQMPFMKEYTWYAINNDAENFGLSSVKHLLLSDDFQIGNSTWYFGISPDERICALASKAHSDIRNPLSNANDCTIVYSDAAKNEFYFVVGILLLDDGQYFCRLN